MITPSAAHSDITQSIQSRFSLLKAGLEGIWPCDINGEPICTSKPGEQIDGVKIDGVKIDGDPVYNFGNVQTARES